MVITYNIETVASDNLDKELLPSEDNIKLGNIKDPEKVKNAINSKIARGMSEMSLSPLTGKIVCISFKIDENKTESLTGLEHGIVSSFTDILKSGSQKLLVGYNSKRFDFPFIFITAKRLGIDFPYDINTYTNKWDDYLHVDIMQTLSLDGKYHKLREWAIRFGIEPPFGRGSMVGDWYANGELSLIVKHSESNVEATYSLYRKIYG